MAIREPIEFSWKGKKKKLVIDMLIIERVNNEIGVTNLTRFDLDNFDFVKISKFYYIIFDECGFNAEWIDIYDVIFIADETSKAGMAKEYFEHIKPFLPNFNAPMVKKKSTRKKKLKR
jgi:hypothetical protein